MPQRLVESKEYTSRACNRPTADLGIRLSVGRTGRLPGHAAAESFFASLKNELATQHRWHTHTAARAAISEYIK
ncbi:IS3 family transposase [Streptomyces sp. NPDC088748]|uniref:IS3 family transposase n=1 Tax=Streptomyces sp. NPDC088748 TaxID=3365887 RepID=UPI0037FC8291